MDAASSVPGAIRHLDHFVLPVMDPNRAEKFYLELFGGRVVQKMSDEAVTRIFMKIGENHVGLFSQSKATIPKRDSADSYPRCAFIAPEDGFVKGAGLIQNQSSLVKKVTSGKNSGCGFSEGLVFTDSEGNLLELFKGEKGQTTRIHHMHFDTLSLEESVKFYTGILNLNLLERTDDRAVLGIPANQTIVLHQVKELSEVSKTTYRGRHFAFHVTNENFQAIVAKLHRAGIEERDEHGEREGRRPGQLGTYFKDPSGFRIQITNEDSATFARHAVTRAA